MPKVRKSILPIPVLLILWRNDLNFFGLYSIKSSLCHRVTTNKPLWLHHWLHDIFRPWTQTQAHHVTFCAAVETLDWQVQTDYNFAITITLIITKYRKAARCIGNKFQLQIRKWLVIYTQMQRIVLRKTTQIMTMQHKNKAEAGKDYDGITLVDITSLRGKENFNVILFPFQL